MKGLWLCTVAVLCISSAVQGRQSSRSEQIASESAAQLRRQVRTTQEGPHSFRRGVIAGSSHSKKPALTKLLPATLMPLFLEEPQYPTGQGPTFVAIGDFNGDGKPDLAVANKTDNTLSVLLGNGDGTFQTHVDYPAGALSIAVGDFNGDGHVDLAVANGTVSILLGNDDGTFQPPVVDHDISWAMFVAASDLNNDGKLDLAVATLGDAGVYVLLGNGDGTFQPPTDYSGGNIPAGLAITDLNGDGKPDLVSTVINDGTGWVNVFLGNGDGTFSGNCCGTDTGLTAVTALAVGDFNGDGKPDVAVTDSELDLVKVLLGNGDGTFQVPAGYGYPTALSPTSLAVWDLNGDGKLDLAVASGGDNSVSVLLGNGDGTFQTPVGYAIGSEPESVAVADFNGDGKPDLAAANYLNNSMSVLLGRGDGRLQDNVSTSVGGGYQASLTAAAVGDFNGDGKPDLALASYSADEGAIGLLSVVLANGDGTFHPTFKAENNGLSSVVIGDFNADGKTDLAVAGAPYINLLLGNGDGTFQAPFLIQAGGDSPSLAVADFNGDGKTDLAVTNSGNGSNSVSVLLGNGDGTLQYPVDYATGNNPLSLAVADFNGDGKTDLAVINSADNSVGILLGKGDGTFHAHVDYATGNSPSSIITGDFNRDGNFDLAVTNSSGNTVSVLLGNGDGTFQAHLDYATGGNPVSVAAADFNGDGKPDLAVSNSSDDSVGILLGNGDGTFQPMTEYASPQAHFVTVADFNLDGSPDLAALGPGDAFTILLNIRGTSAGLQSSANPSILGQPVTLTATVHAGVSNVGLTAPTGKVVFMDGSKKLDTQTLGASGVVTLPVNALTAGTHKFSAVYSGDANFNPHTVALSQIVNGPDFGMSVTPGTKTLTSGGSETFALTVTPMYGFNGAVSLTCSVSPTPALAPTCSLNPASVTLTTSGSATSNLTVVTASTTVSFLHPKFRSDLLTLYALWLPISGIVLPLSLAKDKRRQKRFLAALLTTLLLTASALQIACGGGSNNVQGSGGTPPGTYTVTVKAASGSLTHTQTVTITVQ